MLVLKKHVEMGELKFDIGVDRVIVADVFDNFPDQLDSNDNRLYIYEYIIFIKAKFLTNYYIP